MGRPDAASVDLGTLLFVLVPLVVVTAVAIRLVDAALGPFRPLLAALAIALVLVYLLRETRAATGLL